MLKILMIYESIELGPWAMGHGAWSMEYGAAKWSQQHLKSKHTVRGELCIKILSSYRRKRYADATLLKKEKRLKPSGKSYGWMGWDGMAGWVCGSATSIACMISLTDLDANQIKSEPRKNAWKIG